MTTTVLYLAGFVALLGIVYGLLAILYAITRPLPKALKP